ncbi:hypothetical protein SY88_22630 [Clostridiales bacterium PH28_bin88]|nr:hypothetical protein SY88_22630 [Clostridiales bacterium PH28_bin88]
MNSAEIFSRNVKNLLKRKGMKLKELAEYLGLSDSYLSLVLSNSRGNLSDTYKDKIAAVLDTTVADLYTQVEEYGEDVSEIIESQQDMGDRERAHQLEVVEDAIKLLESGHPDVRTALYYGFGSLGEEEAATVARFLRRVVEKYLSLRREETLPPDGSHFPMNPKNPGNETKEIINEIQSKLSEDSRRVLALAAIVGDGCQLGILHELTGIRRELLELHLRELVAAFLVELEETQEDMRVRFQDSTTERVAYRLVNPARRAEIHRQVAGLLAATAGTSYENLAKIAYHYQKAGCVDKSLEFSLQAAETAYTLAQYRHSLRHYTDAASLLWYQKQESELARVYQRIGTIHHLLLNQEEALRNQEMALKLYHKIRDARGEADVLSEIGSIWFFRGEIKKAITNYQKSLNILQSLKERDELYAQVLIRLGSAYGRLEELDQAQTYYREAQAFAAEKGYGDSLGKALTGLGLITKRQRRWEEAIRYYLEALQVTGAENAPRTKAMALGNLGSAYLEKGDLEEAITTLVESIKLYNQAGDARYRAYSSVVMAKSWVQKGDLVEALRYVEEALPVLRQAGDEAETAEAYRIMGHIKRLKKEWRTAVRFFEESVRLLQGCKWKNDTQQITEQLAQAYYDLGSTLKEKGDNARAEVYHRKAYDFYVQYKLNIKYLHKASKKFHVVLT